MGCSVPRLIRSFVIIELLLMSSLLRPTEIKVEALCDLNTITSCGHYLYIRLFECNSVPDPDSACREQYCVGGNIVQTPNDCCLAMAEVPIEWRVPLNALYYRDPTVVGDYCCCDPETTSPNPEPNGDDDHADDTTTTIIGDQTDLTSYGGYAFTQVSPEPFNRQMFNAEAEAVEITNEDRRECRPALPWLTGDCSDDECERRCRPYSYGDHPNHVCKNEYKCCCNYDAARDFVTPYD